ncbi:tyrosine-type recombinase/integrase [Chitiniphilus shinanonensis]|uniref:tyrosine-type recombinase/integrase n=1 Tax=Chitiniphilus shinanonensis TaxID=553088 RepID=UPI00306A8680
MTLHQLTVPEIKNAKLSPGQSEASLNDGGGLFVRIRQRANGTMQKTFVFRLGNLRHTIGEADQRSLGGEGSITLQHARTEAMRLRPAKKGDNPIASKRDAERLEAEERARRQAEEEAQQQRKLAEIEAALAAECLEAAAMTMDQLFKAWDANHGAMLDPHWRAVRQSHWRCHISTVVGNCKVHRTDKQAMLLHYDKLVRLGKEETARRVLALLKQVISWGIERQYVADDHPITRLVLPKKQRMVKADQRPDNFSIDDYLAARGDDAVGSDLEDALAGRALQFAELITLFQEKLPRSTQAQTGTCLMRLMLSTGIRSSEAVRLRWQWINLERKLMIIPAGSMKKRKMHHVHLSDFSIQQLEAMLAIRTGDFVFPAPRKENDHVLRTNVGNDISSRQFYRSTDETDEQFGARLAKRMTCRRSRKNFDLYNLPGGKWTLYDLRRTVATRLEELGIERDMVGRVLAHARPDAKTTGRYARHNHWERRCQALDLLGEALMACEAGRMPTIQADNIVQLRRMG